MTESDAIAPDYEEQDRESTPMQLLVPWSTDSGNNLRLLNRLQQAGYEVAKEYSSEQQTVYNVYPKPERTVKSNSLPPSMRSADD